MTTTAPVVLPPTAPTGGRALGRRIVHGLLVLPSAVADLALVASGDPRRAVGRQRDRVRRRLGPGFDVGDGPVAVVRPVVHALVGVPVGLLFWFLAFLAALTFARGPFYPLVDPGPYDHSWGGPNVIGAWAAHAWVWALLLPVSIGLWWAVTSLHGRLTARLLGPERRGWVLPVTVLVVLAALLFFRAWLGQLA